ncbi:MAG: hypothetical protein Q9160_000855 [Pyrenula sp. 1 TL-2023]
MAIDATGDESLRRAEMTEKFSVFTATEKWCIVAIVSYAAWFSTLSSFVYYPAIHLLAQTMAVSIDKINLTVTSYMAMATVAPTLVGDAADVLGRRPIYGITLSLYLVANVAIALSISYPVLLGLRVLQALAISGMAFVHALGELRLSICQAPSHLRMESLPTWHLQQKEDLSSAWFPLRKVRFRSWMIPGLHSIALRLRQALVPYWEELCRTLWAGPGYSGFSALVPAYVS